MTTVEGFERGLQNAELQRLMVLLVKAGAISQEQAANYLSGMADLTRELAGESEMKRYADVRALQYEDMANMVLGRNPLPREPTSR